MTRIASKTFALLLLAICLAAGALVLLPATQAQAIDNPTVTIESDDLGKVYAAGMDNAVYPNGDIPSQTSQTVTLDKELDPAGYVAGFATASADGHSYIREVTISNETTTVVFGKYDPKDPEGFFRIGKGELTAIDAYMGTWGKSLYLDKKTGYITSLRFYLSHVEENITVSVTYAPIDPFTLTFYRNYSASDSTVIAQHELYYGDELGTAPADPTREGYTFVGWATSPDATEPVEWDAEKTMGDASLGYYALWKKNDTAPTPPAETDEKTDDTESPDEVEPEQQDTDAVDAGDDTALLVASAGVCVLACAFAVGAARVRRHSR